MANLMTAIKVHTQLLEGEYKIPKDFIPAPFREILPRMTGYLAPFALWQIVKHTINKVFSVLVITLEQNRQRYLP